MDKQTSKSNITVTKEYQITQPESEDAYGIPKSDWDRLRNKIELIRPLRIPVWSSIAFLFFGISGTALLTILTLPEVSETRHTICWLVFAVSLVVGLFSLIIDHQQRKGQMDTKNEILDDMKHLETKHGRKQ